MIGKDNQQVEYGQSAIDTVRASRDGHAFHEAWAARSALELLPPATTLTAIALEDFSIDDAEGISDEAAEIADMVRYYGSTDVSHAEQVGVTQFKYSIRKKDAEIRAADLTKTLKKFLQADLDFRAKHDDRTVEAVIRYEFATNRPIHENLLAAVAAIIAGGDVTGDVAKQVGQLKEANREKKADLPSVLKRLTLSGNLGSLREAEHSARHLLASWSDASDPDSRKKLLQLRSLVRSKAGFEGQGNNLINRVSVLAELEIDDENQLYPTPDAFPPVGNVIQRPIAEDIALATRSQNLPVIVHAAGGMGKTVLMQAIAERMRPRDEVIVFDGFGAGKWRDISDGRHRPERTLVHLANLLAGAGACDILLPLYDHTTLMAAFRRRLKQAVSTINQTSETARVVLILDAIDHAAMQAKEDGTQSFAHLLLESLAITPIEGVVVIASCRTERLALAVRNAAHFPVQVPPFTDEEAERLILARDPVGGAAEVAALRGRSGNNPRVLDALLNAGRPYDGPRPGGEEATDDQVLDALLGERIGKARNAALAKGIKPDEIDLLLSGLAVLPPPVPLGELAAAHGVPDAEVESFAADLMPLLERTPHGLMFRDEPTETFIRKTMAQRTETRDRVVGRLQERQSTSDYAARALPSVLTALGRTDELIALAFDERVPPRASKVSQRDIRLARLVAALQVCAVSGRHDDIFQLLLEASQVAAGHERSDRFLYEHPDLAAVVGDSEALRRLFATKVGWPGGRHAALSLAYIFAGDMGEAQRNSHRAIDWLNWAAAGNKREEFTNRIVSTEWDDVGFTYTEMVTGNQIRVAQWFAKRDHSEAYRKFADLLDLLERQAAQSGVVFVPKARLDRALTRCRLKSRALYMAAIAYSDRDAQRDRTLIGRLANCPVPEGGKNGGGAALLAAVARAISLGMKADAKSLLATFNERPSVYDFSYAFPERGPEHLVIAAGMRVALRRDPASLMDVSPADFLELVPVRVKRQGAKAFEAALNAAFAEGHVSAARSKAKGKRSSRRRNTSLSYEDKQRHRNALSHRISPLVSYADLVAKMVAPPPGTPTTRILAEGLDKLASDVFTTSNYPYRDGKAYIGRLGALVIFQVADAIDAFDAVQAERFVAWVKEGHGLHIPELTRMTARLSRKAELHDSALSLGAYVEALIQSDTDTSSKIASYGKLARAVWRVSADEAGVYFRRALELAEAVGSNDFDRANHLLALCGRYDGTELEPQASYNLARILELNTHEAGKFPWNEYADAVASTAGLGALAIISRIDDRDHASLGQTLTAMLAALVSTGRLPADIATSIMGLGAPVERWSWRLDNFADRVVPKLDQNCHEWFFDRLLMEIDRTDRLSPWKDTIDGLLKLAGRTLPATSPSIVRLKALSARLARKESITHLAVPAVPEPEHFERYDVSDPDEIDRAIGADLAANPQNPFAQRAIRQLAATVSTPAERFAFVRAVAKANSATLAEKLGALDDHLTNWSALSAALNEALPQIAIELAGQHASELVGHSWETDHGWRKLLTTFRADRTALTAKVIASLGPTATEVSGDSWIGLAAHLAPAIQSEAFRRGLNRYLLMAGAKIPEEVGDGPWDDDLDGLGHPLDLTAKLIWVRLGNFQARARWRASHAIRQLARCGRFDVIDKIIERFDAEVPRAFISSNFPFFVMHARLWLLIALARIARDHPEQMNKYRDLFERVAFDAEFPHVAMRAYAANALREIVPTLAAVNQAELRNRLATVNASPFPLSTGKPQNQHRYASRPEGSPAPANEFHLEYEFNKDEVSDLASLFDLTDWEISDRITRWVRTWDAEVRGMYSCERIGGGDYHAGSWSNGPPETERYGGYLGWHAFMIVAGQLLASMPLTKHRWKDDAWADFLQEISLTRPDGLWLSDATDLYPVDLGADLPMPDADKAGIQAADRALLAPLVGLKNGGQLAEQIVVSGSMHLAEDVTVEICSVLVDRGDAEAAMLAALSERKFFQWLPGKENEIDSEFWREDDDAIGLVALIRTNDERYAYFDRHDPYASPHTAKRAEPSTWLSKLDLLTPADPIVRKWRVQEDTTFVTEEWGTSGGRGDHRWEDKGDRVVMSTTFLRGMIAQTGKTFVGLIKAQKFFEERSSFRLESTNAFSHRVFAFSINAEGRIGTIQRISQKTRAAIDALDEHSRSNFGDRFLAIRKERKRR